MIAHLTNSVWFYAGRGEWAWPRWAVTTRGADEFGRRTVLFRLPGGRALVWAYRTCRCEDCDATRTQTERGEVELRRVCQFYGVSEDVAWDMTGDEWNRALLDNEEPA